MSTRVSFPKELSSIREILPKLVPILESQTGWYGSIYFERKSARSYTVDLKQSNVSDQVSMGVVLRIYDGYTLFEQATDDLNETALKLTAQELCERVRASKPPANTPHRPYTPPSWKMRLEPKLEEDITSQVPKDVTASTPVHFGIRVEKDPTSLTTQSTLDGLKGWINRALALAPQVGLKPEDLTYVLCRQGFSQEDSIFIDRETNMSQSIYRLALTVVTMSGADRTVNRIGGLGGLESIEFKDEELKKMLRELRALKDAARLEPGRYRVLFGPVLSGVLAHEAFGHSQEGDTCARGRSKAWELHKTGERVGNQQATILNNPAIFHNGPDQYAAWGSYFFDEEGWLAQEQILLDQGKLNSPMTNLTSALRLGVPRTANGKRESWSQGVYTRQTNTYFSAGDKTLPELFQMLGDGFVALEPAGGMEDPKGMGIQVGIQYLEEVKGGKPTGKLYRGPAGGDIQMTGYTPDVLQAIVAKSKIEYETSDPDHARHPYNDAGGCGKYHKEFVNAGCGGPFMLLDPVILG